MAQDLKGILKVVFLLWAAMINCSICKGAYAVAYENFAPDSNRENDVYSKVKALIEIVNYTKYVDSVYDGKIGVSFVTRALPAPNKPYYWVQVGIVDLFGFIPQFNFYIYPDSLVVKFHDTVNDKVLSVEEWRNRKDLRHFK